MFFIFVVISIELLENKLRAVAEAGKVSHVLISSLLYPVYTRTAAAEDGAAGPLSELAACSGGDLVSRAEPELCFSGNSTSAP